MGNISSVTRNGMTTTYVYDKLGQLIRVNDPEDTADGTTWVYEYDLGGNILCKKRYAYTTGELGSVLETIAYEYDTVWKDKLVKYDGNAITYDAIGNPLTDGTWTYTWEKGRQLKQMTKPGTTATFAYNADGLRIRKIVNGVDTNYTLHGKNTVHMTQGANDLHFWYAQCFSLREALVSGGDFESLALSLALLGATTTPRTALPSCSSMAKNMATL